MTNVFKPKSKFLKEKIIEFSKKESIDNLVSWLHETDEELSRLEDILLQKPPKCANCGSTDGTIRFSKDYGSGDCDVLAKFFKCNDCERITILDIETSLISVDDKLGRIESYCNDLIHLNRFNETIEGRIASKILKIIKEE